MRSKVGVCDRCIAEASSLTVTREFFCNCFSSFISVGSISGFMVRMGLEKNDVLQIEVFD